MCQYYRKQYGCDFISAIPPNLYGSGDNFDLETSHVFSGIMRKMHLAKCFENSDFGSIRKDLDKRPLKNIDGEFSNQEIIDLLETFGIVKIPSGKCQLTLLGSGTPKREFLHVEDLANAVYFLMKKYSKNEHINIGTGEDITINNLANLIKGEIGFLGIINWGDSRLDGAMQKLLCVDSVHNLNWRHTYPIIEGIKGLYKFYKKEQV